MKPYDARQIRTAQRAMKVMGPVNTWLFRATGGKVGGRFPKGQPVLLMTSVGRRSGEPRTVPLLYLEDDDDLVVVASQGGLPMHPAWYHNVVAHPEVTIEVGTATIHAIAVPLEGAERDEAYARQVEVRPNFGDYETQTDRTIPVVALTRAG